MQPDDDRKALASACRRDEAACVGDLLDEYVAQRPAWPATEALARAVTIPVIASGGVSRMDDLIALRDTGVIAGAISGRALYDGAIDLAAALKALQS